MDRLSRWQTLIFCVVFIGYAVYYLNRKTFTYLIAFIIEDTQLEKEDLGIITSSITLAYTFSKFFSSLISDSVSARIQFSVGLVIVGLTTLQFSASSIVTMFAVMYFVNGVGQGSGWPPCVKLLKQWFLPSQLGFLWSLLSASSNIAGTLGPVILPYFALHYGWRSSMWLSGVTSLTLACIAVVTIKNTPSDVGLSTSCPVKTSKSEQSGNSDKDGTDHKADSALKTDDDKNKTYAEKGSKHDVITSPFLWIVSFLFLMVKFESSSCEDWGQLYLVQDKGFSITIGSSFLSVYSVGAAFGSISAGYVTDRMVAKYGILERGSARYSLAITLAAIDLVAVHCFRSYVTGETSLLFMVVILLARGLMFNTMSKDEMAIIHLIAVLLGACQYSCFSLYGVIVIEHTLTHLTGTSYGIAALCANIGGILAGYPLSYLSNEYNWSAVFMCVEAASLVGLVTLVMTRNVRSTIGKSLKQHKE